MIRGCSTLCNGPFKTVYIEKVPDAVNQSENLNCTLVQRRVQLYARQSTFSVSFECPSFSSPFLFVTSVCLFPHVFSTPTTTLRLASPPAARPLLPPSPLAARFAFRVFPSRSVASFSLAVFIQLAVSWSSFGEFLRGSWYSDWRLM